MRFLYILFCALPVSLIAQFAPAVGQIGSSGISKDSGIIVSWVDSCNIKRGWQDITNKGLGLTSFGNDSACLGNANITNGVVSIGDSGVAICYFKTAISNGIGADFAVFENSFDGLFLELAFVEVSTDGVHYNRFEATSNTDTIVQVNGFGQITASKINNLAGKYLDGYGTPFDLQEIQNNIWLNRDSIHYIKLIDVVGTIQFNICSRDFTGRKINDPFPTPFPSGGFDLDAIGVIHQKTAVGMDAIYATTKLFKVFPTQFCDIIYIQGLKKQDKNKIMISSLDGKKIMTLVTFEDEIAVDLSTLHSGIYILEINNSLRTGYTKIIKP
jgi:hypothetical protein